MVNTLGGALTGQLVVFPEEGGQSEGFQMMSQQELRCIAHDAPSASRFM